MNAWFDALHSQPDAHLHDCLVLNKDWYVTQDAYNGPTVATTTGSGLLRFLSSLLTLTASLPMALASMERYFNRTPREPGTFDLEDIIAGS
jgi:hypothetical protein